MKTSHEYAADNMDWGGKHQVVVERAYYKLDTPEDVEVGEYFTGALSNVRISEVIAFKKRAQSEWFMLLLKSEGIEFTYQYKWLWPWTQMAERKRQNENENT